jgi:7-cyano-7-deazaguanine synthase
MKKVIISLSGGMDSTTLLGYLLDKNYEVKCVNFQYGSKHNSKEKCSFRDIVNHYNVQHKSIDLSGIFSHFESNLLSNGGDIPSGHYAADNMTLTVVPGRNSIMTTILAGLAESIGFDTIALGQHHGDFHIYPDCRPKFVESINETIRLSSDDKVQVIAPFIDKTKADICKIGLDLNVPYHLTTTCYNGREKACSICGSCSERIESFLTHNAKDPIDYEVNINWDQSAQEFINSIK